MLKLLAIILMIGMSKSELVNIDCKYGYEEYEDIKNINRCLVLNIDAVRHENMDVNVNNIQTTYGGQNIPQNIEGFEAGNKPIFFFPGKIGNHFPNARIVKIRSSSLRKITSEDFKLLNNLEYLDLNDNFILVLPVNLFFYTQKLQIIKLKNNRINYIYPAVFKVLTNLRSLDIYDNTCYTGGAKNLDEALVISNVSLCSEELLYSCGAFSYALNLINSQVTPSNFQMTSSISMPQINIPGMIETNFQQNNYTPEVLQKVKSIEKKFDEILGNFIQLNQTCQNVHEKVNSNFDAITKVKNEIIQNITDSIQSSFQAFVTDIKRSHEKDENRHDCNHTEPANTKCECNNNFTDAEAPPKLKNKIRNIENDSNNEEQPKSQYESDYMMYVSLLSCIIFLLIIILVMLVILCIRMPKNSTGNDDRFIQPNNEYTASYMARNHNRASENPYQMTNFACHQASIRDQQQTNQSEQQEYEEIPENSFNPSQTYYGRATRNNGDDFYEEQPNLNVNYSDVNGGRPTGDYAAVYRPVNSGAIVSS